jgi:hypothetical protein
MSMPPNYQPPPNYPPPGQYYGAMPPQQNTGNGCLKAFGITCGVLILLFIIGSVFMGIMVKKQLSSKNSFFGQATQIGLAGQDGKRIQEAIVYYQQTNGRYPSSLNALVPRYLPDSTVLHSSLDPNTSPSHITWQYIRPTSGAMPNTPILVLPYNMTFMGQTVPGKIVIDLDGQLQSQSSPTYNNNSYNNNNYNNGGQATSSGGQ